MSAFAATLHLFSPKAFNYVRQKLNKCLPRPKTIPKWYSTINNHPGFDAEAFKFLKIKSYNSDEKWLVCSLVFDEIAVRKYEELVGDRYCRYIDFCEGLHGDDVDMTKEALVFMLVCIIESKKIPIGYFFIWTVTSEQKASLVNVWRLYY